MGLGDIEEEGLGYIGEMGLGDIEEEVGLGDIEGSLEWEVGLGDIERDVGPGDTEGEMGREISRRWECKISKERLDREISRGIWDQKIDGTGVQDIVGPGEIFKEEIYNSSTSVIILFQNNLYKT